MSRFWEKNALNIEFVIWNTIFRISRRKNSEVVPCGVFLSCVLDEMFIDIDSPFFPKTFPALKNSWLRPWYVYIYYIYIYICIHLYLSICIIYIYNVFIIYIYIYIYYILYIYICIIYNIYYIYKICTYTYISQYFPYFSYDLVLMRFLWDFYVFLRQVNLPCGHFC